MYRYTFIIPLLTAYLNVSHAETVGDVNVTSPIFTNSINESKYPTHTVTKEEINTIQSIGNNLKNFSGVSNADYGIAIGQPVLRGLTGDRTRILSNGIQANDLSHISGDHSNKVDLNNISFIEVIKGPSSLFSYGATSGGVINVVSDIISEEKYESEIKLDYLTVNNGYGHNVLVKENFYDTNVYFSFNNKHLDNYSLPDGALFEEGVKKPTLSNSDYKNQNFNLGLTFPREWGYFGIAFDNVDSVYGIPYHAHEEEEEEEEEAHRTFSKVESETYTIKGRYNRPMFFNAIDYSYRDSNYFLKEHEEDGSASLNNNSKELMVKFDLDNDNYERKMLLQYNHRKSPMTNAYLPSSESFEKSVAYFTRTKNKSYEIDFAGRYDINSRDSNNQRYGDTSLSFATSYAKNLNPSLFYTIGYAHTSRSPAISELFANGTHGPTQRYERGDTTLKREVSRNIELGIQYNINDFDIGVNLYRNNINNYIFLADQETSTSGKTDANWSQKSGVFQGYEISLSKDYIIDRGIINIKLSRDDISAVFDDNTYVPRITPTRNTLSVKFNDKNNTEYNMDLLYAESQGDFSSIETKTNSYVNINLGISKMLAITPDYDLALKLYANNILNKTVRNHESFVKDHVPAPGGNVGLMTSINYKF